MHDFFVLVAVAVDEELDKRAERILILLFFQHFSLLLSEGLIHGRGAGCLVLKFAVVLILILLA